MRRIKKVAAAAALAALTASSLLPQAADAVVGQVRASGDYPMLPQHNSAPSRGKAGPNLAVNPTNPQHVVALHQELETEECEYNSSIDGGTTWRGGADLQAPAPYPTNLPGPCDVTGHGAANIGQQSLAFGSGNNVYAVWTSTRELGVEGYGVLLSKSTDGGLTFGVATEVTGLTSGPPPAGTYYRPEIVIDRRTAATDRIILSVRDGRTNRALIARSEDAGATWLPVVEASNSNPITNPAPVFTGTDVTTAGNAFINVREVTQPVLGAPLANGIRPIYVGWVSTKNSGTCPPACEAIGEDSTDAYYYVARSLDNGNTFTRTRAINLRGFTSPAGSLFGGSHFPRLAAGINGELFTTFNQGPGVEGSTNCGTGPFPTGAPGANTIPCPSYGAGSQKFNAADHFMNWDLDVWFMRSTNLGDSWTDLRQLNEPKKPGLAVAEITQTRHPQIKVAPDGRIDIVWEDRRHWYLNTSDRKGAVTPSGSALVNYACVHSHANCPEARLGDTYFTRSSDNGLTFALNRRVNDRSHNNDVGYDYRFSTYWDYGPNLAQLGNDQLVVADMDARLGNPGTESQDIFLRKVNLNAGAAPAPTEHLGTGGAAALSAALSLHTYPGGAEAVHGAGFTSRPSTRPVIVNESDSISALPASVLARANLGPLLASPAGGLTPGLKAEVSRLSPVTTPVAGAFIVGDTTQLSAQVQADLVASGVPADQIVRISGGSPADVAAQIALNMDRRRPGDKPPAANPLPAYDAVIIANPNSASASAASVLAANRRLPILYVDQNSVPAATSNAIAALNVTKTIIVGTTGVVSGAVASQLPNPTRLGGSGTGYRLVGADGSVYTFGNAGNFGSLTGIPLNKPVVGSATTASGNGYWMVASDGGIFAFGDAGFFGSAGGIPLNKPIVGMAPTSTGNGYWLVASDGGIFAYGDAKFFGSTGGIPLNKPIVGMAPTPTGNGYWLVASDGGIFAFGDAKFFGSTGGIPLNKPVVGMASTPSGNGYWLVASDGGIFAFGDAQFFGSTGGIPLNQPVIGMTASPTGQGYNLLAADGGIFSFGDAEFLGSTGGQTLPAPVVAMAPSNKVTGVNQFATSNAVVAESIARGLPRNIVYVADGNEPMHGALLGAAAGRAGGLLTLVPGGTAAAAQSVMTSLGNETHLDEYRTSELTGAATVGNDPA